MSMCKILYFAFVLNLRQDTPCRYNLIPDLDHNLL